MRVASVPKMMSGTTAPPAMLPIRHPMNSPGMAAGVNTGKMVRASATRTWISLKEMGANTTVSAT